MSNDLEEPVFTDELKPDFNDPDSTLQGAIEPDLLTSFKPGEYSYFKPGAFSTWEGPNHWKMRRVPNSGRSLVHNPVNWNTVIMASTRMLQQR